MIVLTGLPASGKSTIGRKLAQQLGCVFLDCDKMIESEARCSIPEYFAHFGEVGFRSLETRVLTELLRDYADSDAVMSTGGGVVVTPDNRRLLKAYSQLHIVYLFQQPDELLKRLRNDGSRPLLAGEDREERMRQLFEQRDPLYREVAHHVLPCHGRSASRAAADIRHMLGLY